MYLLIAVICFVSNIRKIWSYRKLLQSIAPNIIAQKLLFLLIMLEHRVSKVSGNLQRKYNKARLLLDTFCRFIQLCQLKEYWSRMSFMMFIYWNDSFKEIYCIEKDVNMYYEIRNFVENLYVLYLRLDAKF